ncbi:channel-forming protein ArfA/OmpATb [Mycobacterium sp.]|uniref:channel-forming protein ArfA/OmpATb n=1 Tax=Mycobacterium sp. TaxID=1785 RepID=UPI003F9E19B4
MVGFGSWRAPRVRSRGLAWLIGLVVIPLLIAAIGYGAYDHPRSGAGPGGAAPSATPSNKPGAPKLSLAPLSISRNGKNITLSGDFPDDSAKAALMKSLKGALGPGVNVIDQIKIDPSVDALDFSNAGPIFTDSASITDFNLTVNVDTVTLAGTAASTDQKNTIDQAATHTWSNLNVVDHLVVNGPVPPPGPPAPGPCDNLQAAIDAVTGGPVTFAADGFSLTRADDQILSQVADKLKACPNAHTTINGYTDNTGTEGINIPLSSQRGNTVADFLVAHGVARDHLVVRGLGSINPVASNDTPDGRAKNRRVEIVVS